MWFKNLRIYRLGETFEYQVDGFETSLSDNAFEPCAKLESRRIGWIAPLGNEEGTFAHGAAGCVMIAAREQEKLLPASAIREQLDDQVAELERKEGREVGRSERRRIKDDLVHSLLPRALTRSQLTYAILAPTQQLLLIDSSNANRAEKLLDLLRDSLGTLPVQPLQPRHDPSERMTRWLASAKAPAHFTFGGDCDLRDPLDTANVVRCRAQELAGSEIRSHLDAGKRCNMLGLTWTTRVAFQLAEDLSLRRLRFTDLVTDLAHLEDADPAAQFDSDFAIQSGELLALAEALGKLFGERDAD